VIHLVTHGASQPNKNACCIVLFVTVVDKNRTISHSEGSHGVPGIFVKYDLSSLRVHIRENHQPFWQLLVRLCGIVGGIFATSGKQSIVLNVIFTAAPAHTVLVYV